MTVFDYEDIHYIAYSQVYIVIDFGVKILNF